MAGRGHERCMESGFFGGRSQYSDRVKCSRRIKGSKTQFHVNDWKVEINRKKVEFDATLSSRAEGKEGKQDFQSRKCNPQLTKIHHPTFY